MLATIPRVGSVTLGSFLVVFCVAACGSTSHPAASSSGCSSKAREDAVLTRELRKFVRDYDVPGAVAILCTRDGTAHAAAGFSDVRAGIHMRPADDFRIASVTKPFVAAVVLQLVGERKLRLDDTVEHWLPGVVPGGRRITIRELLNHTSGIPEYFEDARVQKALEDRHAVISPRKLIAQAVSHPLAFKPGRNWGYSNTNYLLLGLIVEKVTGKSIRAELMERIFRPLGLTHTALEGPGRRHDKMRGYQISAGGSARDLTDMTLGGPWSDDGIVSNADDLGRFFSALLGGKLLQPRELRAMTTVAFPDSTVGIVSGGGAAGLGIFKSLAGCVAWGHGGQVPGYTTSVYASADGSRVAIFATNGESLPASRELDRMAADLFCSGG